MASNANTVTLQIETEADLSAFNAVQRELDQLRETTAIDIDTSAAEGSASSLSSAFDRIDFSFTPLTVGLTTVTAGFAALALSVSAFADSAEILTSIDGLVKQTGRSSEISAEVMQRWSKTLGGSLEEARIGIRGLLDSDLNTSQIERLIPIVRDLSRMSDDFSVGDAKDIGKLFNTDTGIISELSGINGQLVIMSERAMDSAIEMQRLGDSVGAQTLVLDAFERKAAGFSVQNPMIEFSNLSKNITIAGEGLGRFILTSFEPLAASINKYALVPITKLINLLNDTEFEKLNDEQESATNRIRTIDMVLKWRISKGLDSTSLQREKKILQAGLIEIKREIEEASSGPIKIFEVDPFFQRTLDDKITSLRDTAAKQSGAILSDIQKLEQEKQVAIRDAVQTTIDLVDTLAAKRRTEGVAKEDGSVRALNDAENKQLNESIESQKQYFETIKGFSLTQLSNLKLNGQLQTEQEITLMNSLISAHREFNDSKQELHDKALERSDIEYEKALSIGDEMIKLFKDNEKTKADLDEKAMRKSLDLFEFELNEKERIQNQRQALADDLKSSKKSFIDNTEKTPRQQLASTLTGIGVTGNQISTALQESLSSVAH